jgi:hypothetical protein
MLIRKLSPTQTDEAFRAAGGDQADNWRKSSYWTTAMRLFRAATREQADWAAGRMHDVGVDKAGSGTICGPLVVPLSSSLYACPRPSCPMNPAMSQ